MKRLAVVALAAVILCGCHFKVQAGFYRQQINETTHYGLEVTGRAGMSQAEFDNLVGLVGSDGTVMVPVPAGEEITEDLRRREGETEAEWLKRIGGGE
jgi:hypothetical protein